MEPEDLYSACLVAESRAKLKIAAVETLILGSVRFDLSQAWCCWFACDTRVHGGGSRSFWGARRTACSVSEQTRFLGAQRIVRDARCHLLPHEVLTSLAGVALEALFTVARRARSVAAASNAWTTVAAERPRECERVDCLHAASHTSVTGKAEGSSDLWGRGLGPYHRSVILPWGTPRESRPTTGTRPRGTRAAPSTVRLPQKLGLRVSITSPRRQSLELEF